MEYSAPAILLPEMRAGGEYKKLSNENYIDLINYMDNLIKDYNSIYNKNELALTNDVQRLIVLLFTRSYCSYFDYNREGNGFTKAQFSQLNDAILMYHLELYRFINGDSPVGSAAPIAYLTHMRSDLKDDRQDRLMKWPAIHFSELLVDKKPVPVDYSFVNNELLNKLVISMGKYDAGKNFSSVKTVAEILKRNLNNQGFIYGLMFRLFHANCVIEQPNLKGNENGII